MKLKTLSAALLLALTAVGCEPIFDLEAFEAARA